MSEVRYGPDLRVLVVGGGVAGLTLCGLLRRRGFRPRLVEARGPGYETRRDHVLGVWPSGTDVLKGLGLYDHLARAGQELRAYVVADERGTTVRRYDLRPAGRHFGPAYLLPRSGFLEALRAGLGDTPECLGTSVRRLTQHPDAIEVALTDGTADTFDLVVGADGVTSAVRALAFGPLPMRRAGLRAWAFRVDTPPGDLPMEPGTVVEQWGRGRFCGVYPAKGVLGAFLAVADPALERQTSEGGADDSAPLRASFDAFCGPAARLLAALPGPADRWRSDLSDLARPAWCRGRVVLVGDAAHATLPAGAGAALAMESAAALAEELTRTDSRYLPLALERYAARRARRVNRVRFLARALWASMAVTSTLAAAARAATMRRLPDAVFRAYFAGLLNGPF